MTLGVHIDSHDILASAQEAKKYDADIVQIFLTLPGTTTIKKRSEEELKKFKQYLIENNMLIVVHSSYTHNTAKEWNEYSWWIRNIELEIIDAYKIGAIGLVIHMGKQLDLTQEEAYNNMYTSLMYLHNKTKKYESVKIFLETSTGQGSELCYKLNELGYFYKKLKKMKRFQICIDTCHVFSAGYNLSTFNQVKLFLETFDELIGLKYVGLIHLNDCKVKFASYIDRHANIGKGYIGLDGLSEIYKFFVKMKIPLVLETPDLGYKTEIHLLKNLIK